jgi:hypothetical protein
MIDYEERYKPLPDGAFKYCKSLVYLTVDSIIDTRRNSRVDLHLYIRSLKSQFRPDCLIIVRLSFSKERIGHALYLILTEIAHKYDSNHIGIEFTNAKSSAFAKRRELRSCNSQSNRLIFQ